jgi:replicative DNA helicase
MVSLDDIKLPPHNTDAEKAVLGSIFLDNDILFILDGYHIVAEDFYQKEHQYVFAWIKDLRTARRTIDVITLTDQLSKNNTLDLVWWQDYLYELSVFVMTTATASEYAKIVKEKSVLRGILKACQWIIGDVYDQKDTIEIIDAIQKRIFDLTQYDTTDTTKHIKEILEQRIEEHMAIVDNPELMNEHKIMSWYHMLDEMTNGFKPGELIVIAARPAMGKTAFALNILLNAALKNKKSVAFFSLEMGSEQIADRLLSNVAQIWLGNILRWTLTDNDFAEIGEAMGKLSETKIFLDDQWWATIPLVKSKLRKIKIERGSLDMVIIDYLQLMSGAWSKFAGNRVQEISEISRGLKELARELKIPIVALSQLSRNVEARVDKKPNLSDLRESGAIEQDADMVLMLYRDDYYDPDTDRKGIADILIRKNRSWVVWEVPLHFRWDQMKFYEVQS